MQLGKNHVNADMYWHDPYRSYYLVYVCQCGEEQVQKYEYSGVHKMRKCPKCRKKVFVFIKKSRALNSLIYSELWKKRIDRAIERMHEH